MSRFRPAIAAACLATFLMAALPAPGAASRSSELPPRGAVAESLGDRLLGNLAAWGCDALAWLQAIIAAEHGNIVPLTPPPPPPPPADLDPAP